jgi:monoamine oxidase
MAPHAKFFAIYDRPFWREDGLSGTAHSLDGPLAEIHDATTYTDNAALFGFVGIPAAQRAILGPDVLRQAAIDQLARIFGPEAVTPRATLLKDWATSRFTAAAADAADFSHPGAAGLPKFGGEWKDRLALAGSETSRTEPGYLAGAVEASRRAVEGWIEIRARYV